MIAAFILILAALAAVVMVWTRLQADFDQPTIEQSFRAIDDNSVWVTFHGAARIWLGAFLISSQSMIGLMLVSNHRRAFNLGRVLLSLGGIAFIMSGVITVMMPGAVAFGEVFGIDGESYHSYRQIAGNIGSSFIGLALIAMVPIQWRTGGVTKTTAILGIIAGVGMLLVWWDAASLMHRITGAVFLIWLVTTAAAMMWTRPQYTHENQKSHRLQVD